MPLVFRERRTDADPRCTLTGFRRDLHGEVLEWCELWSAQTGIAVEINHGSDGQHKEGSLHPPGLALDLDTVGDRPDDLRDLFSYLTRRLSSSWDIIHETTHIHVEWDPR